MRRREFITMFGAAAVAWPLAAGGQSTTQPTQATTANPPQIEVVRVKPTDPTSPKLGFQLSDGSVDLMKSRALAASAALVEPGRCRRVTRPSTRATVDGEARLGVGAVRLASNTLARPQAGGLFQQECRGSELSRQVAVDFE